MTERQSRISSHFAISELAAFPFTSEVSLRHAPTSLSPGLRQQSTLALWRGAERHILGSLPSMSLDEFVAQRDSLWFDVEGSGQTSSDHRAVSYGLISSSDALPLLDVLRRLACRVLHIDGAVARPRLWTGDFVGHHEHSSQHARSFWKWLSLAMPPDLLLAAIQPAVQDVDPITPTLDRRLHDKGFAEAHVHFGASLDFADFWAMACNSMLDSEASPDAFSSAGACLDEGRHLASWVIRALIVRFLLASYLGSDSRKQRSRSFSDHIAVCERRLTASRGLTVAMLLRRTVAELRRGELLAKGTSPAAFHNLQRLFVALQHEITGVPRFPRVLERDPITVCFGDGYVSAATVELTFLRRIFAHLESSNADRFHSGDPWLAECVWQCVRVRCLLYRHVVQRPLTPGLPWFLRTFARLSAGKEGLSAERRIQLAARCSGAGKGLRSLELRTSPYDNPSDMLALVQAARKLRDEDRLVEEIGLVFHFVRDRGDGMMQGSPSAGQYGGHADPSRKGHAQGARYGEWYRRERQKAFALAFVLRSFSEGLEIIRGIDLCADEAGIPTWVVKPLVTYLRSIGRQAVASRPPCEPVVPGLRMTVHAGEDWLHLLGGLRRIQEAHEHFMMESGDRLGHGLALGVDPERWARESGPIAMPKETRLFDLIWAWTRHRGVGSTSIVKMEEEIRRLMRDIFDGAHGRPDNSVRFALDPWLAAQFVEALHDERIIRRVGFPGRAKVERDTLEPSHQLVLRYLYDVAVFSRGQRITHVDPRAEGPLIAELQQDLRDRIGANDIAIEINPSSNFLTNQLPSLREHPTWRLRKGGTGDESLPIVIGSDDPIVFATKLREEYQLLHDALVLEGKTTDDAYQWLEEVRENGLMYRWTLAAPPVKEDTRHPLLRALPSAKRRPLHPTWIGRATDKVPLPP